MHGNWHWEQQLQTQEKLWVKSDENSSVEQKQEQLKDFSIEYLPFDSSALMFLELESCFSTWFVAILSRCS